jgi:hypothetical protein
MRLVPHNLSGGQGHVSALAPAGEWDEMQPIALHYDKECKQMKLWQPKVRAVFTSILHLSLVTIQDNVMWTGKISEYCYTQKDPKPRISSTWPQISCFTYFSVKVTNILDEEGCACA